MLDTAVPHFMDTAVLHFMDERLTIVLFDVGRNMKLLTFLK